MKSMTTPKRIVNVQNNAIHMKSKAWRHPSYRLPGKAPATSGGLKRHLASAAQVSITKCHLGLLAMYTLSSQSQAPNAWPQQNAQDFQMYIGTVTDSINGRVVRQRHIATMTM